MGDNPVSIIPSGIDAREVKNTFLLPYLFKFLSLNCFKLIASNKMILIRAVIA